jgi:NADH-quinone oxidoreductase subunit M
MILSYSIWLPIIFGLIILFTGSDSNKGYVRIMALIASLVSFAVTLPLVTGFDTSTAAMQFVEQVSWIPRYDINYFLGVDGISMWFVVLTAFITVIVVVAAWEVITVNVSQYMAAFLILSGLMIGVFSSLDGLLFYVFFEATLIPMYIIIGVWGGPKQSVRGVSSFSCTPCLAHY